MNPFLSLIDWLEDNLDVGAPIGAFIGMGLAMIACFIWG